MINIKNIKINLLNNNYDELKNKIINRLKINKEDLLEIKIIRESIDARDKNNIMIVYEVDINVKNENIILKKKYKDVSVAPNRCYKFISTGTNELINRPIIVGSGPAGLFCAYNLVCMGYKPLIIERGKCIEERVNDVNIFFETNKLNSESNISFGEGGAGTFSDGKLNTLIKDINNRGRMVMETFIDCGAPKNILYSNHPHIGTDLLRSVIVNLRNKIISMGGEFRFNTKLTNLIIENNCLKGIVVNDNIEIDTNCLVLAIGHSARDTIYMLNDNKLDMESKPFAVGVRIQHKQKFINESQYGKYAKYLDNASYKLTYKASNNKGVYSFCMCPGGYVINASSEENHLVVNGMSNHNRDSENSNSAIIVTVNKDDYGDNLFDGIKFQKKLEKCAYSLGNGNIPIQLLGDYLNNRESNSFKSINPIFMGKYTFANLNKLFSDDINKSLHESFAYFDKKIKGFNNPDCILAGVESRTSSPIRIIRDENLESNIKGIYPCGEGCGYAGGITSAAIDGIKVSECIGAYFRKE
jgi:uncharacterized FAD-dependent dehydrogenase